MITAALLGNPNVGKTTLFNLLTGSNQYVGNWAGVTIEKIEGIVDNKVKLVDLPGIYALDTYSNEEKISKQFITNGNVDVLVNIVDASNLNRNLYLTLQLKQFNKPIVLVLNMIDVAESKGIVIDCKGLSKALGVTVVPISASKKVGIDEVKALLCGSDFFKSSNENDYHLVGETPLTPTDSDPKRGDVSPNINNENEAYKYIENILKGCTTLTKEGVSTITDKVDKLLLNRFLAYPLFLLILFIIFKFTFNWVGQPLSDAFDTGIQEYLIPWLENLMANSSPWFKSLIIDGIVGGVGAVIVFLPVILALFLGISFLEDSGYMARAAFIMDRIMRKMGLSGKAFIPLVISFGCSVPGIMSTRTLESDKDRKMAALLAPLMSCNARLPVYAVFTSAFFPENQTTVVFALYLLGIAAAFIIGLIFKNTIFKKDDEPLIIELPEYKLPDFKSLLKHTWRKGESFLRKMGTIIFSAAVIVWFLSNFNFAGISDINKSFLSHIGEAINPIFTPLGFSSWQNSVSLLTGLVAKEVVVGTMGVLYAGDLTMALSEHFTPLSAFSFMVFTLLYTPCISVIATMKKEYGSKMMMLSVSYQLVLAWIAAFIVYNIGGFIINLL